jgi:peptide/nickel transport system substrate-binding protein
MSRSKIMIFLAVVMTLSFVLAACQPKGAATTTTTTTTGTSEQATSGETTTGAHTTAPLLRIAVLSDMNSMNVWYLFDNGGASYWNYVEQITYWPAMLVFSDQRFDVIPQAAADLPGSFTQEGDYWVNTVTLKEGLVWSDGSPITADDVAFTVNTALKFELQYNWVTAFNAKYLIKAEAVDPLTVKYYYNTEPGIALWQYGALSAGPIVSKAFWETRIADAVAMLETPEYTQALADIDSLQAQLDALTEGTPEYQTVNDQLTAAQGVKVTALASATDALETIDPTGEPHWGPWSYVDWEQSAYIQNEVNPNYQFNGLTIEEYVNGAYREYKESIGYEWSGYGEPTGDMQMSEVTGPYFDSVLYTIYDQDTAVLALMNNDVDMILNPSGLSLGAVAQMRNDPAISIVENPDLGFRYMDWNEARSYLSGDAGMALRQAVACMIDYEFLTETILQGQVAPAYTLVPAANGAWYNTEVRPLCDGMDQATRISTAVQILKDAGYTWENEPSYNTEGGSREEGPVYGTGLRQPNGEIFPDITLMAPSAGYDPLRATTAIYMEQWMRILGIPATAQLTAFNTILSAVYDTQDFDVYILGVGITVMPSYMCDFFNNGDGTSPNGYYSEAVMDACERFQKATTVEEAVAIAGELQALEATELPYTPLFSPVIRDAYRNVQFAFTDVLGGLQNFYGFQDRVWPIASQ